MSPTQTFTDLIVPSPTPFWPASSSSRSLKLLGITKEGQVTQRFLYYINQIPTCPGSTRVRCHLILKSDRSLVKRITLKILLIATFSFTSDFTELMAGSCSLLPKLMKTRSKLAGLGRPHINCHSLVLGPKGCLVLKMMKIESLKQLVTEGKNGRTEVAISWAHVGAKKNV